MVYLITEKPDPDNDKLDIYYGIYKLTESGYETVREESYLASIGYTDYELDYYLDLEK